MRLRDYNAQDTAFIGHLSANRNPRPISYVFHPAFGGPRTRLLQNLWPLGRRQPQGRESSRPRGLTGKKRGWAVLLSRKRERIRSNVWSNGKHKDRREREIVRFLEALTQRRSVCVREKC